jgi:hypothetical protein
VTVLRTNGVNNPNQTVLDLDEGSGITLTGGVGGKVSIASVAGGGTVTSVAQTVPAEMTITGSPITVSGTLAIAWNVASGNKVIASPAGGGSGAYAGRALVALDIPNIAESQVTNLVSDLAALATEISTKVSSVFGRTGDVVATLGDYDFSLISGMLAQEQLPAVIDLGSF